ncbi:MAG: cytochrome b [Stellaceae bacterium]
MSQIETRTGYGLLAKTLHWLIFALLVAQYCLGWTMPDVHRDTKPEGLIAWHLAVGATILGVVLIRLVWRAMRPVPLDRASLPRWQARLAQATHWLLYIGLVVMLLLGWANASARGFPVLFLGLIPLPPIMPVGSRLGLGFGDIHIFLSWCLLALIALHVLAALYHRLILRDLVLQRMLRSGPA